MAISLYGASGSFIAQDWDKVDIDHTTINSYMWPIQLLGNTMPIFSMLTPAPVLFLKQGGFRANNSYVSVHINWIPVCFVELSEHNRVVKEISTLIVKRAFCPHRCQIFLLSYGLVALVLLSHQLLMGPEESRNNLKLREGCSYYCEWQWVFHTQSWPCFLWHFVTVW